MRKCISWGKQKLEKLEIFWDKNDILYSILIALVILLVLEIALNSDLSKLKSPLSIAIFLEFTRAWYAKKHKIERLTEELDDYRLKEELEYDEGWMTPESRRRTAAIIKRLVKLDVPYKEINFERLNLEGYWFGDFSDPERPTIDLSGCNFTMANLKKAHFIYCNLHRANFNRADLFGTEFIGNSQAYLEKRRTDMSYASFEWAYFDHETKFMFVNLSYVNFFGTTTSKLNLNHDEYLNGAYFLSHTIEDWQRINNPNWGRLNKKYNFKESMKNRYEITILEKKPNPPSRPLPPGQSAPHQRSY